MQGGTRNAQNHYEPPERSSDVKWRSFPKVPNLVQCVSTGFYFGRVKIAGKVFRESLDTDVFTTAKLLSGNHIEKKVKHAAHCRG